MDENKTIATVNGIEITRRDLDMQIAHLTNNPNVQAPAKENEEQYHQFEHAVLDHLINDALIFSDAQKQGITADEAKVEEQYAQMGSQFENEEAFQKRLQELNITPEQFKDSVRRQMIMDQYYKNLFEKHDVTASEEEMQKLYDEHVKPQENAPSFEDAKQHLKMHVENQKVHETLSPIVAKLREDAEISTSF